MRMALSTSPEAPTPADLPGDRVRLIRTRGFDGTITTRVWTVPGLSPEGLRDDLAALTAAIEKLRHEARGEKS